MKHLRLVHKLFAGLLAAAATLIAVFLIVMGALTAQSYDRYFAAQEKTRIDQLLVELADVHRHFNGFNVYRQHPFFWERTLMNGNVLRDPTPCLRQDEPLCESATTRPADPLPDPAALTTRTALYDLGDRAVAGAPLVGKQLYPIGVAGKQVGSLGVVALQPAADANRVRFVRTQMAALFGVAAAAFLLCTLFAWLFARRLGEPIQRLSEGTQRLRRRDFTSPIEIDRDDELGVLATDFNQLANQLTAYEENQRRWIGDIAHELRTPLSVVAAEVEAILDGVREPTPENLGSIRDEVTQLTRLVEDLHSLSVVESGSLRLQLERQDLLVMVLQFADALAPVMSEQQLSLRIASQAEGARTAVMADRHRFRQVVTNLLGNTIRYANKPGWVELAVREDGPDVCLTISDSGPGVPPDALPQLFDRLFRVEESRNRARGGSGLGLAIVRSIIEAHGGSIKAENIAGAGLRMTLRLPKITTPERI